MRKYIYGASVQGASHKRSGKVCQDSHRIDFNKDIVIVSVADGHGSESCPYSKTGSTIAVNVFYSVMSTYYNSFKNSRNGLKKLMRFLNREGELKVAQTIDQEWKRRVYKQHVNRKRKLPVDVSGKVDKNTIYKMYGSTLLGLVITKYFVFSFQLGDGDICSVSTDNIEYMIQPDKLLGVETHSLCKKDSWKNAISSIQIKNDLKEYPHMYMLSSDGMSNSYRTQNEFEKACKDYYAVIETYGFEAIEDNLEEWLLETTEEGCGDDVTAVLVYCK